jgi:hypothetical protein
MRTLPKNLSSLLDMGENPNGIVTQTPAGTQRGERMAMMRTMRFANADGMRWNADPEPDPPPLDRDIPEIIFTGTPAHVRPKRRI